MLGVKNAEHVEAKWLLIEKKKNPEFDDVDYWWLDEYMLRITFGRHVTRQNKCADCERNGGNSKESEQGEQSGNTHSDDIQSEDGNDSEYDKLPP